MNSNESVYLKAQPINTYIMENKEKENRYIRAKERVDELKSSMPTYGLI